MSTQRIQYVDAMRGLAMLMVVIWHVFTMSLHCENTFSFRFNWVLQMPVFVMISGFFANKLLNISFQSIVHNKFIHLVLPALIMMTVYCWACSRDYINTLYDIFKGGYWFTFILFAYLLIFYILSKLIGKCVQQTSTRYWIHLFIAMIIAYASQIASGLAHSYPIISLFSINLYCYYPYLVVGSMIYQYRDKLLKNLKLGG